MTDSITKDAYAEKDAYIQVDVSSVPDSSSQRSQYSSIWKKKLLDWGVEGRGIVPVPAEQRTDTRFIKIFFIWFTANFNVLSFSSGTIGPVVFGLGLRDSCLVILFFNLLCIAFPAYLSTWGPKLGMRQMVAARYTFGYYGVLVPCILNIVMMTGFCVLNCIVAGQTLSSVTDGSLSWNIGIVIIAVLALLVSFCGYRVLNWFESYAWLPVLVVFLVAAGISGKHLDDLPPSPPAEARTIITFASTIAGWVITYSSLASDFSIYFKPNVPSWRIFIYTYLGFLVPIVMLQCFGAAAVIAAKSIPAWEAGYKSGETGGLIAAMLGPAGGFGKFLTVILSLSVMGNLAATFYSISLNMQVFLPAFAHIPRYFFSIIATGIVVPLSIAGAHRFYSALVDFVSVIGYWAGAFISTLLVEHLFFRRGDFAAYDLEAWDVPRRLPSGVAALGAGVVSLAVIVPSMDQVWFTGPIAKTAGDIGFEVALAAAALLYLPFRALEVKLRGHV